MPTQGRCPKCGFQPGGKPPQFAQVWIGCRSFLFSCATLRSFSWQNLRVNLCRLFELLQIFVWWPYHVSLPWKRWCEFDFFFLRFFLDDTNRSNLGSIPWRWVLWSFSVSWMLLFLQPRGYLIGPRSRGPSEISFRLFFGSPQIQNVLLGA